MITNLVVGAAVFLSVAFVVAWLVSPRIRAWVERPKYRFQDAVREYDRERNTETHGSRPS